jgi:hypothetical protein
MVAVAPDGGVTVDGLTAQAGGEVVVCEEETWQVRSTVPVKPMSAPTEMFDEDVPPGATASGENGAACRLKSCADAGERNVKNVVNPHKTNIVARPVRIFKLVFDNWDFNWDFNMSRFK